MSNPIAKPQSEPSTASKTTRLPPVPIQTQSKSPALYSSDGSRTPPSAGPGAYDSSVIPPSHEARTLVLCFDGTGDQFDADNSNIIQFFSMLKKDDKSQQLVYYQAGIGTYTIPEVATPLMARIQKSIDMAIGNHLDAHVMGGYEFLMEQYHAEDKICIFGFSRAGMIHKFIIRSAAKQVGLLPAGNHQQIPFAYKMFTRDDEVGWSQSTVFKKSFSVDVEIEFVGVWDTVCSVGLIPRTLPFTASNTAVRYFRHAISLDERRAKFKANHWHVQGPNDTKGTKLGEMPRSNQRHPHYHSGHKRHHKDHKHTEEEFNDGPWETDVLEVWFAGCHCDVGGGSVPNGTRNSLARIPLRWMIRQCFLVDTGIQFHRDAFKDIGMDPDTLFPFVAATRPPALKPSLAIVEVAAATAHALEPTDSTLTDQVQASPNAAATFKTEEDEELADALSLIYDELKIKILPIRHNVQNRRDASWKSHWKVNMGGPRKVPKPLREKDDKVFVHRSVKIRMEAEGLKNGKYMPKAKFEHLDFEWVD
ncbi:hypothetical protein B0F90DRAFT_1682382 [Multifurca ochricompacta]|uniref:T6SS Phospholipase effector Tle1-like catalytic domain-containing protein n=1 Tax=Multifurca ochricompacta TaxID=376703 RepID=A0AAD4QUM5_9AGAM|nr:hypothetical protein B0F90DRAFT_1682382 [Multifurca ochricompacta]